MLVKHNSSVLTDSKLMEHLSAGHAGAEDGLVPGAAVPQRHGALRAHQHPHPVAVHVAHGAVGAGLEMI